MTSSIISKIKQFVSKHKRGLISFFVTTFFFVAEALIHFSIGKQSGDHSGTKSSGILLPTIGEFADIVAYVFLFAFLSAVTTELLNIYIFKDKQAKKEQKQIRKEIKKVQKVVSKNIMG